MSGLAMPKTVRMDDLVCLQAASSFRIYKKASNLMRNCASGNLARVPGSRSRARNDELLWWVDNDRDGRRTRDTSAFQTAAHPAAASPSRRMLRAKFAINVSLSAWRDFP